jgi:hypothetical protein
MCVGHLLRQAMADDVRRIAVLNGLVQALHVEHRPDRFRPPDADAFTPVVEGWLRSAIPLRRSPVVPQQTPRRMHQTGEYTISDLGELFLVSRPTVYRTLSRTNP